MSKGDEDFFWLIVSWVTSKLLFWFVLGFCFGAFIHVIFLL